MIDIAVAFSRVSGSPKSKMGTQLNCVCALDCVPFCIVFLRHSTAVNFI